MNNQNYKIWANTLLWITLSTSAIGQTHDSHSGAMPHAHVSTELPTETGQSAFAAIAEIVALLEYDPQTNWSTINIDGLRSHLVDMNQLTLSASVTTRELDGLTIQFQVTGQDRTLQAIQTMIPAHAQMVRSSNNWSIEVISKSEGVTLRVTPESSEDYIKLKALGFFGFMTIGAHHQLHHLQMAKGAGH
ncbi:MAG: hypothetical protein ACI9XK_004476 [Granulosicoccus sp.]|jgi:hypothetical protein